MRLLLLVVTLLSVSVSYSQITVLPQDTYDFGSIEEGEPAVFAFEFKNTSNEIFSVQGIFSSCGCTTAKPSKDHIATGESTILKVVYDTRNRIGPFNRSVEVHFSGKKEVIKKTVILTGNVTIANRPKLSFDKSQLELGVLPWAMPTHHQFIIRNTGLKPLEISKIEFGKKVIFEGLQIIDTRSSASFELPLPALNVVGLYSDMLTVHSNDPGAPRSFLSAVGWVEKRAGLSITTVSQSRQQVGLIIENYSLEDVTLADLFPAGSYLIKEGHERIKPGEKSHVLVKKGVLVNWQL